MCEKTTNVPALFGKMVFGEQQMQQRLPAAAYQKWQQCLAQGTPLDRTTAGEIANAMKDWAIEKGATHYTHWFQPMTGVTAEKHDSFITRDGKDAVVMELSAKELSKGFSRSNIYNMRQFYLSYPIFQSVTGKLKREPYQADGSSLKVLAFT